ncbi:hypothetical protein TNCV_4327491 [Trichonephila clavipes]|nr:hypothetical protein TNCV_4327491 [Trichonephila clavipes]
MLYERLGGHSTTTTENNVQVVECSDMSRIASIQHRHHTVRKQKSDYFAFFPPLVPIDNGATILNGLLCSNDNERRRGIRCIPVTDYLSFNTGFERCC